MVDKTPKKPAPTPPPKPAAPAAPAAKAAIAPTPPKPAAPAAPAAKAAIAPAPSKKVETKAKLDPKERTRLIQEAAYFRSLKHAAGSDPALHWLAAEKEIDLKHA